MVRYIRVKWRICIGYTDELCWTGCALDKQSIIICVYCYCHTSNSHERTRVNEVSLQKVTFIVILFVTHAVHSEQYR